MTGDAKLCLWVVGALDDCQGWGYVGGTKRMPAIGKSEFDQLVAGGYEPPLEQLPLVLTVMRVKEEDVAVLTKMLRRYHAKKLPAQQPDWSPEEA